MSAALDTPQTGLPHHFLGQDGDGALWEWKGEEGHEWKHGVGRGNVVRLAELAGVYGAEVVVFGLGVLFAEGGEVGGAEVGVFVRHDGGEHDGG